MIVGINTLFLIPDKVGGTETYSRELINSLADFFPKDHFYIFCNKENYKTFSKKKNVTQILINVLATNRPLRHIAEQLALPFYCFKYKIDILHSLGYSSPLVTPCKKVVTIHDLNWYFHPEDFSFFEKLAWKISTTLSAKFNDHIITDSVSSKNDLKKYFSVSNKVTSILCGLPKKSKFTKNKILKKYKIKKKYLLTVLGPYPHKNLNTAITAWKNFSLSRKDKKLLQFVVCGTRSNSIDKKNNIIYLPHLNKKDLVALYKQAHVFIFPSLYEGFGFPPIEAMSYGVPVISSNSASLSEVVGRGGVLIKSNDADLYTEELRKIWDNRKRRSILRKKGLSWIKRFNWEDTAKYTMNVYKKTI